MQIQAVINTNLIPPLIDVLKNERYQVSKEALRAICNAILGGTDEQVSYLVNQGVIGLLCDVLNDLDHHDGLLMAIDGITRILEVGRNVSKDGMNGYTEYVVESGGVHLLESLQSNYTIPDNIHEKAAHIIVDYFDDTIDIPDLHGNDDNMIEIE